MESNLKIDLEKLNETDTSYKMFLAIRCENHNLKEELFLVREHNKKLINLVNFLVAQTVQPLKTN